MINIAIVDDEQINIEIAAQAINEYFAGAEYCCDSFISSNAFLCTDIDKYDIIFLDIEMPEIDGIRLAGKIHARNKKALIFYITSHASLVTKAINNYAFTFLPKPINKSDLFMELDRALQQIKRRKKTLDIMVGSTRIPIKLQAILYIEVVGKTCKINLCDGSTKVANERLINIKAQLDDSSFVQCHKSYIVNLAYVDEINRVNVLLQDCSDYIPISRSYAASTINKLNLFLAGISALWE